MGSRNKSPKRVKRTDPHRPGAIVPAEYRYVFSYNLSTMMDGWPIPSHRVNCELDRRVEERDAEGKLVRVVNGKHDEHAECCIVALRQHKGAKFGGPNEGSGKCSICGTHFVYGDVWFHEPTGEYVHVGHQCAEKYEMIADRSEWERAHGRHREAAAVAILKRQKEEDRQEFLAAHPGLEEDLKLDHDFLREFDAQLRREGSLTDRQVAFAQKLAAEIRDPSLREKFVPAPVGRQTFQGTVVSVKEKESISFGVTYKLTVKIQTEEGAWLAWGTCPASILDVAWKKRGLESLRGAKVEVRATLKQGRDAHFAMMSRPTGQVLCLATEEGA